MSLAKKTQLVTVDGHELTLSNLDKVMYPETGTTKADVLDYYARIAAVLIPHVRNRPATRKRWVHGVGTVDEPGPMFFNKDLDHDAPIWIQRHDIQHKDHVNSYPLINDRATLTWFAQRAALEIHVPQWRFDPHGTQLNPDRLVLDLDPGDGTGLPECAEVARLAKTILSDMGLAAVPVTSGSKGIHLYAALAGDHDSTQINALAHELARSLEADHPELIVSDMKKNLRSGKVLIDWSQNNAAKTTITPYSLRGRAQPMVAAPRTWHELASPQLGHLDYREVLKRVEKRGDPLADLAGEQPGPPREGHDQNRERVRTADVLHHYRSKRDPAKTPEPVPLQVGSSATGRSFVIQEHDARRLHYDFRLERDGVLVSWALPKGVPLDPARNHLAVQTEDHPVEYGGFEGTIPPGEYGAGTVKIWDHGEYELEKWWDDEIVVTLRGAEGGGLGEPRRFVLFRTEPASGKDEASWMIHLMKPGGSKRSAYPPLAKQARATLVKKRPAPYRPMLASQAGEAELAALGDDIAAEWAIEMKWDGIRAIIAITDGRVSLWSRSGQDVTASYPELQEIAQTLTSGSVVLDGEIVAFNARGVPDFGVLQQRMNLSKPAEIAAIAPRVPVSIVLFDLLERDGTSLLPQNYAQRRNQLEVLIDPSRSTRLSISPIIDQALGDAMEVSAENGLEGVMLKELASPYSPGRRSRLWLKLPNIRTQEAVIVGWRPGNGRFSDVIGSVLLATPDADGLRYIGRVGTGFDDEERGRLLHRLAPLERKDPSAHSVPEIDASDARWVDPMLVCEVSYRERTRTGKLRQPVWRGFRTDKSPADL